MRCRRRPLVATLVGGFRELGTYGVHWCSCDTSRSHLALRVYPYRLQAGTGQVENTQAIAAALSGPRCCASRCAAGIPDRERPSAPGITLQERAQAARLSVGSYLRRRALGQRVRNNARRRQGERVQDRVSRSTGRHRREEMNAQQEERKVIPSGRDAFQRCHKMFYNGFSRWG